MAPVPDDLSILPLTAELLPVINAWRTDPNYGGIFDDFGAKRELTVEDLDHNFLITLGQTFIGDLQYHLVQYGPNSESLAANIGVTIHPDFRNQGFGSRAQQLFADQLLEKFHRVEASTDVENHAEQRALEKAGFTREGILRGAQFRDGKHHDLVSYSRVRD